MSKQKRGLANENYKYMETSLYDHKTQAPCEKTLFPAGPVLAGIDP